MPASPEARAHVRAVLLIERGGVRIIEACQDGRVVAEVTGEHGVVHKVARNSHGTLVCTCTSAVYRGECAHKAAIRLVVGKDTGA